MQNLNKKTVLILVNKETTIIQFRLEVVDALVRAGYNVIVSSPKGDRISEIEEIGATVIPTPMEKDSTDPIKDFLLMSTKDILLRLDTLKRVK